MAKTKQAKPYVATRKSPASQEHEGRYFSRAVGKAIQMLEMLARTGAPMGLSEISKQIQLTKSSAFRLLQTLETLQYIRRDSNGHYIPLHENGVAVSMLFLNSLIAAAREPMRKLNMEFGETVSLAVLMHNHIEVIQVNESAKLIRMTNIAGRILPPHASSMGKAITAWQDAETRKRLLQSYGLTRYNENTIVDEHAIEAEYERIRALGYSTDAEETTSGGYCFGMAIFSAPGKVDAAISLSMPSSRLPAEEARQKRIVQALCEMAEQIAQKLAPAAPKEILTLCGLSQ